MIALTHDIGHPPFSHATEKVLPEGVNHEDLTRKIIMETEIAEIIDEIGEEFARKHGDEYIITPKMICDIYGGKDAGVNSEFTLLKTFMDSELDCDKMDYLLRDSYYCGVRYGVYDVERLISSFTIYFTKDNFPRLAIKSGGVQAFEEFVLARYFMFIQVYFHRTRRYFDIMLGKALEDTLPEGVYPKDVNEYLKWDDCRVLQMLKENVEKNEYCKNIIERIVYPQVCYTKTHPNEADIKDFKRDKIGLDKKIGKGYLIIDSAADKMPHKIPKKVEKEDEKAIIIYDAKFKKIAPISEESEIIKNLSEKIDIRRIYCHPIKSEEAREYIKDINEEINSEDD